MTPQEKLTDLCNRKSAGIRHVNIDEVLEIAEYAVECRGLLNECKDIIIRQDKQIRLSDKMGKIRSEVGYIRGKLEAPIGGIK